MQSIINDTGHDLFQITENEEKLKLIQSLEIFSHKNRCTNINFLNDHLENLVASGKIKIKHKSEISQPWNGWFSNVKKQFQKVPQQINRNPLNNFSVHNTMKNGAVNSDIMFKQITDLLDSVIQLNPEDKVTIIACTVTETGLINLSVIQVTGEQFMLKTKMNMILRGYILEVYEA